MLTGRSQVERPASRDTANPRGQLRNFLPRINLAAARSLSVDRCY